MIIKTAAETVAEAAPSASASIEEQYLDAMSGMLEKPGEGAEADTLVEDQEPEERTAARFARLDHVKSRRQTYREIALEAPRRLLPHGPCRFLCRLLEYPDPNLDNAFPRLATLARAMGVPRSVAAWNIGQLVKLGWITRREFYKSYDGRQSSSGIQFRIPPLAFGNRNAWLGPARFDKHEGAGKRQKLRTRQCGNERLRI